MKPLQQLAYSQLLGEDIIDRRNQPMKHVVLPFIVIDPLNCNNIPRLANHAHNGLLTPNIATDFALFGFRDVLTSVTEPQLRLGVEDRVGQTHRLMVGHSQQMVSQTLGRFRSNAREFF